MDAAVVALTTALFLSGVTNRLVEYIVVPVYDKFDWDKFSILYVSWAFGGLVVGLSGVNLFGAYLPDPIVGQVFTAIVAGGGANLINDKLFPS